MIGMLELTKMIVLGVFLFFEGIRDLRKHNISMIAVIIVGVVGGILQFNCMKDSGLEIVGGILVGVVFLIMAKVTGEKIGYGDGWVFAVSGLYLGFRGNIYLLLLSLFGASMVSIFLLLIKKIDKNTELPFVSFMLPSYLLMFAIV